MAQEQEQRKENRPPREGRGAQGGPGSGPRGDRPGGALAGSGVRGQDLLPLVQFAEKDMLRRINHDSHVSRPDHEISGLGMRDLLEVVRTRIEIGRTCVNIGEPGGSIDGVNHMRTIALSSYVDVRIEREYQEKHIKGAISLPYGEKSKKEVGFDAALDTFRLTDAVKDRNAPLIFACNGEECWKSYKASVWAQKEGYKNVYWFRGGFPEWKGKNLPLE